MGEQAQPGFPLVTGGTGLETARISTWSSETAGPDSGGVLALRARRGTGIRCIETLLVSGVLSTRRVRHVSRQTPTAPAPVPIPDAGEPVRAKN
jgi:hypothetical protein